VTTRPKTAVWLDLRQTGKYVTAECQLGAHWGCPGGFIHEGGKIDLRCRCTADGCECNRSRKSSIEEAPGLDA
jgi:hypothetical protein